jgi:hypothetical protein
MNPEESSIVTAWRLLPPRAADLSERLAKAKTMESALPLLNELCYRAPSVEAIRPQLEQLWRVMQMKPRYRQISSRPG